jgi:hypothetical protein
MRHADGASVAWLQQYEEGSAVATTSIGKLTIWSIVALAAIVIIALALAQ